jgi:D-alanyl-lipoteichoic acid acyltransferase DltB (MBOAT superfamily)
VGSASLTFLAYAFAVVIVFNLKRSIAWRQFVLLAASIGFLGFFSLHPGAFLPLAAFLLFGFVCLRTMQVGKTRAFLPSLFAGLIAFMWLKKYAFIPPSFFLHRPYLTLGLSYICFRVLHLIIDARNGDLPKKISLISYLNYTLNFTTLVSGPIQRYQKFEEKQLAPVPLPLNIIVAGQALERIIVGFFKVNVLSLFLSMIQASALNSLGSTRTGGERVLAGTLIAAAYPMYLYCNFSGYIDIVIGIARFLRIELPENFNRPFSSDNFVTFWSRWHITLSTWLKTYVYNPLLIVSMRRWPSPAIEPFLGVFAFFVTFFLVGVWHGQTSVFIFFGVLQGLGVSLTKLYQVLMAKRIGRKQYKKLARHWLYNIATRGLTFTYFTFTLLWFWSNWTQLGFLARSLHPREIALVWITIFLCSSVILALWEAAREWLLSFQYWSQPLLQSRYVRMVRGTALVVITAASVILLNAPAPDIVYKVF